MAPQLANDALFPLLELVVAPRSVVRGRGLMAQCQERFSALATRWLLVGGQTSVGLVLPRLQAVGIAPVQVVTLRESTEALRRELAVEIVRQKVTGVIACGGGLSLIHISEPTRH